MSRHQIPNELEAAIGYPFSDKDLLVTALTRTMYANEHNGTVGGSMDALATVGDAVLGTVVVSRLYENGTRDKGTLTPGEDPRRQPGPDPGVCHGIPARRVHPLGKGRGKKPGLAPGKPGIRYRF